MSEGGAFFDDEITPNLDGINILDDVVGALEEAQDEVLGYAQANAPWADRTGIARDSLGVDVYEEGGDVYLELYHGVDYGLWLEVIQSGRYATIMPTLEALAGPIFDGLGATLIGEEFE